MPEVHVVEMTPEEQERAVGVARRVAAEFDNTGAAHDRDGSYAVDMVAAFRDSGLPALCVPKRFGGWGADIWTTARCVQALAYGPPTDHGPDTGIYRPGRTRPPRPRPCLTAL